MKIPHSAPKSATPGRVFEKLSGLEMLKKNPLPLPLPKKIFNSLSSDEMLKKRARIRA
jgi:hypothetical protein